MTHVLWIYDIIWGKKASPTTSISYWKKEKQVSFLAFSKVSYISSMPILVPFLTLFSTSVRCNKAFSKLITKVMFIWPLCWYSRSHDCRILYVIGTPDHMIAGYYMLLVFQITWLQDIICYWYSRSHDCMILYVILDLHRDTDSYSLSVFYIPWAIRRGRYSKQTGNVNLYPQWSPNNKYILLKCSDQSNTRKTTHKLLTLFWMTNFDNLPFL